MNVILSSPALIFIKALRFASGYANSRFRVVPPEDVIDCAALVVALALIGVGLGIIKDPRDLSRTVVHSSRGGGMP